MTNKKPIISIKNLEVTYNKDRDNEVQTLKKVSLDIYPEEYIVIFGPSGCGKSTLLYAIAGLQKPTNGEVLVGGKNIYQMKKREMVEFHRKTIGMVFQAFYLISSLNVIDNVCVPKTADGAKKKERVHLANELLKRFSIFQQAKKMPNELSGGQKQRVSIARSLINNPQIILADEPVGNLDSVSSRNVMKIFKELNERDKKAIILVTHDPNHLTYGDRIVYFKDGVITKEEIVHNKTSPDELGEEKKKNTEIKEIISNDLKMLMKSFRGLSPAQFGNLMIPYKAEQLINHILLGMNDFQLETIKRLVEETLYGQNDFDELTHELDINPEDGGAGLDKRLAENLSSQVKSVLIISKTINFNNLTESSRILLAHLIRKFDLKLKPKEKAIIEKNISKRLSNQFDREKLYYQIDLPIKNGGAGLDRRTAIKIVDEIEIILLIKYGF